MTQTGFFCLNFGILQSEPLYLTEIYILTLKIIKSEKSGGSIYYDETNKYVGVFQKNTPINIIKDAEHTFSVIEYE